MTFDVQKASIEGSRPVELYEFSYQGITLRYTSADQNVSFGGNTYIAVPGLTRTGIDESDEIGKAAMTITCPEDFEVSELFNFAPPDDVVGFALREMQYGQTDKAPGIWLGRVLGASWPPNRAQLRCESLLSSVKQAGLRRPWGRNCPYILYGPQCKEDRDDNQFSITIQENNGLTLKSADFALQLDTFFSLGYIEWLQTPSYKVRRGIKEHIGNQITITHPIRNLEVGAVLTAYPGCDHTYTGVNGCIPKFDNGDNYGGFPHQLGNRKNPFQGPSVF